MFKLEGKADQLKQKKAKKPPQGIFCAAFSLNHQMGAYCVLTDEYERLVETFGEHTFQISDVMWAKSRRKVLSLDEAIKIMEGMK